MKKLNRKGFTLVELLAVIIILAIVVGITIPAVLTTTKKATQKAFQTAADTAADWFDRQYQVAMTGLDGSVAKLDANFKTACGDEGTSCTHKTKFEHFAITDEDGNEDEDIAIASAAGLKASNIRNVYVSINPNTGRTCVILLATNNGDYAGAGYNNMGRTVNEYVSAVDPEGELGSGNWIASSGCAKTTIATQSN